MEDVAENERVTLGRASDPREVGLASDECPTGFACDAKNLVCRELPP